MNDNFDYFKIFGLSKQDSQKANYEKLKKMTTYVEELGGSKGMALQLLHNEAMSTFKDEIKYQDYLKKLDAQNSPTDNKLQAELEKERQKTAREAEARHKAQVELEKERQRAAREAEDLYKAQAEAEEAKLRAEGAERRADQAHRDRVRLEQDQQSAKQKAEERERIEANLEAIKRQSAPANLSGFWQDSQGIVYNVVHTGNQIRSQGSFLYQTVGQGIGTVNGRTVQMQYRDVQGGITDLSLELSTDGQQLTGSGINYTTGQRHFFQLWRR